jgi:DNA polymerase III subunit epsilon
MSSASAQLSLDGADRLHALLAERGEPLAFAEAARELFALRSAPAALVRQLVEEVVRSDARFVWRSAGELALAEWDALRGLDAQLLEHATYVVFDLETTGASAGRDRIVELGAVRLRGFERAATLERLVDPRRPLPPAITLLTGIRAADLRGRPRIERVLDEFLRFAEGAVLVAHNARFDIGFLDAELRRLRGGRLAAPVLDTVALARRLVGDRLPRVNLATLAERYDTQVRPCHRALPDAEATAEIFVRLLGLAQEQGARTVADAVSWCAPVPRRVRTRRRLVTRAPPGPGVYLFVAPSEDVLYVGKASDLRSRVRSYFGSGRLRPAVEQALEAAGRVECRPLGSAFEAALLELELLRTLRPPGNRRSTRPDRLPYLCLTLQEPLPRLQVASALRDDGGAYFGPLRGRADAEAAALAARAAFLLRGCRPRLPQDDGSCLAGALGSCHAPCRGGEEAERYAAAVEATLRWLERGGGGPPERALLARLERLRGQQRYEEAAAARDRLRGLHRALRTLAAVRTALRRAGIVLAPDLDDRFVQAFACRGGIVVGRRRLPRIGDAALELEALVGSLVASPTPGAALPAEHAESARIVAAAFTRPGSVLRPLAADVAALAGDAESRRRLAARVARRRRAVPLRR